MSLAADYLSQIEAMSDFVEKQVSELSEEQFKQRPGPSLNPVAFSYFHLLRVWDLDLNWIIKGQGAHGDAWHRGGFSEKAGYDPDGKGTRGMGIGTGFTDVDVDAMRISRDVLRAYQQQLMAETQEYLNAADNAELSREVAPLSSAPDRKATCAQRLQHTISHSWSHIGELRFAKGMLGFHDPSYPGGTGQ